LNGRKIACRRRRRQEADIGISFAAKNEASLPPKSGENYSALRRGVLVADSRLYDFDDSFGIRGNPRRKSFYRFAILSVHSEFVSADHDGSPLYNSNFAGSFGMRAESSRLFGATIFA